MKNPLSKTELTGLLLLAIIVVAITGAAFFIRGNGPADSAGPAAEAVAESPGASDSLQTNKKEKSSARKDSSHKKNKSRKKRPSSSAGKAPARRSDPFSDTIPRD